MITKENYPIHKKRLKYFLIIEINKKIKEAGNSEILSVDLLEVPNYVDDILKRGSFGALERLYKRLYGELK